MKRDIKFNVAAPIENKEVGISKNQNPPPRPKKGEYIVCQYCGEVMRPQDFSKDEKIRRREFKWHCHEECRQRALFELDVMTNGVLSERKAQRKRKVYDFIKECKRMNIPLDKALTNLEQEQGVDVMQFKDVFQELGFSVIRMKKGVKDTALTHMEEGSEIHIIATKVKEKPKSMLDRLK